MISIVISTLLECGVIYSVTYNLTSISVDWLESLGYYALYAVILLPICRRLHQQAKNARTILVAHSGCLAVLGMLLICALAIETAIMDGVYDEQNYTFYRLVKPERDLRTACYVFEVIAMLMAAASMITAMMQAPHLRKGVGLIFCIVVPV